MCISFLIVNENQNYGWIKNIPHYFILFASMQNVIDDIIQFELIEN